MKIVLIGAGSRSFGLTQITDILATKELRGHQVTLSLVDEDERNLGLMLRIAKRIRDSNKTDIKLEASTSRLKALPGADYVITAVARHRYPLWEQDFRIPLSYGFRHCLGENGGPGALFHTLRSLHLLIPICKDVERLCPNAWFFNFTNPEARVLHGIGHLSSVKSAGFCHGVVYAVNLLSKVLKKPAAEFKVTSAGMNHFYTVLSVTDLKTGEELLPKAMKKILAQPTLGLPPMFLKLMEVFGIFTIVSDDHCGEYLPFAAEYTGIQWPYGREHKPVALHAEEKEDMLEDLASGKKALEKRYLRPGRELTVPIICDMEFNRGKWREAVDVLNTDGYVENLPRWAVVEVPARPDANGLNPQHVGAIPETLAAYTRTQYSIHALITEGYRTGSKKLLLQSLLLDPHVNSISNAEKMLDQMLKLQKDFLPNFA
jgi:alpha-galactosidase